LSNAKSIDPVEKLAPLANSQNSGRVVGIDNSVDEIGWSGHLNFGFSTLVQEPYKALYVLDRCRWEELLLNVAAGRAVGPCEAESDCAVPRQAPLSCFEHDGRKWLPLNSRSSERVSTTFFLCFRDRLVYHAYLQDCFFLGSKA
jgi:hypothetical protein